MSSASSVTGQLTASQPIWSEVHSFVHQSRSLIQGKGDGSTKESTDYSNYIKQTVYALTCCSWVAVFLP